MTNSTTKVYDEALQERVRKYMKDPAPGPLLCRARRNILPTRSPCARLRICPWTDRITHTTQKGKRELIADKPLTVKNLVHCAFGGLPHCEVTTE